MPICGTDVDCHLADIQWRLSGLAKTVFPHSLPGQEYRPSVRLAPAETNLDQPLLVAVSAGENHPNVSEQLRLEEHSRQGSTIDRHERLRTMSGVHMDGPGDELIACTRLARDKHSSRLPCHPADQVKDRQIHGDNDATDDNPKERDHERF